MTRTVLSRHRGAVDPERFERPTSGESCRRSDQLSYGSRDTSRCGADDRTRTGDFDLGKVALYQLSYVRVGTTVPTGRERPAGGGQRGPRTPGLRIIGAARSPLSYPSAMVMVGLAGLEPATS